MQAHANFGTRLESKLQCLRTGLIYFGLDPKDWSLHERQDGQWEVAHLQDPELRMVGSVEAKGAAWDWDELCLAAI